MGLQLLGNVTADSLRLGAPPAFPTGWVFRLGGWPAELYQNYVP